MIHENIKSAGEIVESEKGEIPNEARRNLIKKISKVVVVPAAVVLTDAATNVAFAS